MKSKVSIIITCYNLGEFLDEAVKSCLEQTYKEKEILVINDGSEDNKTLDVLKKWDKSQHVEVFHIKNSGVSNARNYGINKSKGEYICCLDADDILDKNYLLKTINVFKEHKNDKKLAIVTSWMQRFGLENTIWKTQELNPVEMLWSNSIHCASVFKKEVFLKVGPYDNKITGHADWDLWLSFIENDYKYLVVKEPLFLYRVRKLSMVTNSNKKRLDIFNYLIKKHSKFYQRYYSKVIFTLETQRHKLEDFLKKDKETIHRLSHENHKLLNENHRLLNENHRLLNENHRLLNEKTLLKKEIDLYQIETFQLGSFIKNLLRSLIKLCKNTLVGVRKHATFTFAHIKFHVELFFLNTKNQTVITLDIFDTLLRRKVFPEEIKLATAQYIYTNHKYQLKHFSSHWDIYYKRLEVERQLFEQQGDYELETVLCYLLEKIGINNGPKTITKIYQNEVLLEQKVLYKDIKTEKFLAKLLASGDVLFLSDFYITKKNLLKLLSPLFPAIKNGYVSCDYNKTKASGKLFDFLLEKENFKKEDLLHLGDNKYSDFKIPRSKDIRAIRYFNYTEELKRKYWSNKWVLRNKSFPYKADIKNCLKQIEIPKHLTKEQKQLFELGIKYSPIFYSFVLDTLEKAASEDIKQIYYLTREGVFLKNIHNEILKKRSYPNIKARLLEVSRVSTFFVSLPKFEKQYLDRMWRQYKVQTPLSFFKSLNIETNELDEYFEKYNIDIYKKSNLSKDQNFTLLIKDQNFQKKITRILENRKELFTSYLDSKGIQNDYKKYMVVDLGWRGSIQDNIAYFLNNCQIIGNYLGLHPSYYTPPNNVIKYAYGPNYIQDNTEVLDIVNWTGIWEMLTNSPKGSIHTYVKKEDKTLAIEQENTSETAIHNNYIKHFQLGVLMSIPKLDNFIETHAISSKEIRPYILQLMKQIVYKPEHILTKAYFGLNHNETFGLGEFTNMEKLKLSRKDKLFNIFLAKKNMKTFYQNAITSCWKNGYWEYHKLNGVMSFLTKMRSLLTGKS